MHKGQARRLTISLLRAQNNRCALCGKTVVEPTLDHIIPRSQGGSNHADNLQVACRKCNNDRGNALLDTVPRRKRPRRGGKRWQLEPDKLTYEDDHSGEP